MSVEFSSMTTVSRVIHDGFQENTFPRSGKVALVISDGSLLVLAQNMTIHQYYQQLKKYAIDVVVAEKNFEKDGVLARPLIKEYEPKKRKVLSPDVGQCDQQDSVVLIGVVGVCIVGSNTKVSNSCFF